MHTFGIKPSLSNNYQADLQILKPHAVSWLKHSNWHDPSTRPHTNMFLKTRIWKASEKHLGGIRETSGRLQETPGSSRSLQQAPGGLWSKKWCPSQLECKSCIRYFMFLHAVFEGQIARYTKLQSNILRGSRGRGAGAAKALHKSPLEPLQTKMFWGKRCNWQNLYQKFPGAWVSIWTRSCRKQLT